MAAYGRIRKNLKDLDRVQAAGVGRADARVLHYRLRAKREQPAVFVRTLT